MNLSYQVMLKTIDSFSTIWSKNLSSMTEWCLTGEIESAAHIRWWDCVRDSATYINSSKNLLAYLWQLIKVKKNPAELRCKQKVYWSFTMPFNRSNQNMLQSQSCHFWSISKEVFLAVTMNLWNNSWLRDSRRERCLHMCVKYGKLLNVPICNASHFHSLLTQFLLCMKTREMSWHNAYVMNTG